MIYTTPNLLHAANPCQPNCSNFLAAYASNYKLTSTTYIPIDYILRLDYGNSRGERDVLWTLRNAIAKKDIKPATFVFIQFSCNCIERILDFYPPILDNKQDLQAQNVLKLVQQYIEDKQSVTVADLTSAAHSIYLTPTEVDTELPSIITNLVARVAGWMVDSVRESILMAGAEDNLLPFRTAYLAAGTAMRAASLAAEGEEANVYAREIRWQKDRLIILLKSVDYITQIYY